MTFVDWLLLHPEYNRYYNTPIEKVSDEDLSEYLDVINFISHVKKELEG